MMLHCPNGRQMVVAATNKRRLAGFLVVGWLPFRFLELRTSTGGSSGLGRMQNLMGRRQILNRDARKALKLTEKVVQAEFCRCGEISGV